MQHKHTEIEFKGHQSNGLSAKRNERRDMLEINLIRAI